MVDQYLHKHKHWEKELELLRSIILICDVTEEIKWGAPVYTVNGKNVVGLGAFKSYVGLWFFQGALLKDNENVLVNAQDGKTKAMRQWRFNSIDEINISLVDEYIREAINNQKAGKEIKPEKSKKVDIPQELIDLLNENEALALQYEKLSPYKQKEYCEYIETAKQAETKQSRLDKISPMILVGKGLNDKYR